MQNWLRYNQMYGKRAQQNKEIEGVVERDKNR